MYSGWWRFNLPSPRIEVAPNHTTAAILLGIGDLEDMRYRDDHQFLTYTEEILYNYKSELFNNF